MKQDPDQARKDDDKTSVDAVLSLDFNFLYEDETETVAGTTEQAEDDIFTLEPPSAFSNATHNLSESSSPGRNADFTKKFWTETPRTRKIQDAAGVPFLGALPDKEREDHHRDQENGTGCGMDRGAFMEGVWTVVQCYGTQSMLKTCFYRPLMREILDKLDECE